MSERFAYRHLDLSSLKATVSEADPPDIAVRFSRDTFWAGKECASSVAGRMGANSYVAIGRKYDAGGKVWTYPDKPPGCVWIESEVEEIPRLGEAKPTGVVYVLAFADRVEFTTREAFKNASRNDELFMKTPLPKRKYDASLVDRVYVVVDDKAVQADDYRRVFSRVVQYQVRKGGGFEVKTKPAEWGHVDLEGVLNGNSPLNMPEAVKLALRCPIPIALTVVK